MSAVCLQQGHSKVQWIYEHVELHLITNPNPVMFNTLFWIVDVKVHLQQADYQQNLFQLEEKSMNL